MTFQYPFVLWGLLALTIPIIIHFFNFRRFVVVEFSTIQFINELKEQTRRKRQLKHLLILASRLLFLFFLICAFAQPHTSRESHSGNVVIYLDNSLSMSDELEAGHMALNEAIDYAQTIVGVIPMEENMYMITNDFTKSRNEWHFKSSVAEELSEVNLFGTSRRIEQVVNRIPSLGENSELYIISDFQKSTFELADLLMIDAQTHLLPIGNIKGRNAFVDTVYVDGPILEGQSNSLNVNVRCTADVGNESYQIKLINGNRLLSTLAFRFDGSRNKSLEFEVTADEILSEEFRIELTDYPVTFDNSYFFLLEKSPRPLITYISDGTPSRFINNVFANGDLFDFQSMNSGDINYTRLSQSNLLILDGLPDIPGGLVDIHDGDILIIPGETIDRESYSLILNTVIFPIEDSSFWKLNLADPQHPFFKGLFEFQQVSVDLPSARLLYQTRPTGELLLQNEFGSQFLTVAGLTRKVYFLASPLEARYTNLQVHSLFLPVFYRMAMRSLQYSEALAYTLDDESISFKIDNLPKDNQLSILTPEGQEFIPGYLVQGNELTIELPPLDLTPGIYRIINGLDTLKSFALNHSRVESRIEKHSIESLEEWVGNIENLDIINLQNTEDLRYEMEASRAGIRLWKYALLLALFFLLCESLLVRFYK